jgi:hypothetical protein
MDILSRDRWHKNFQETTMTNLYGYNAEFMDKLKWSIIGDVSRKFPSFFGAGRIAGAKQSED